MASTDGISGRGQRTATAATGDSTFVHQKVSRRNDRLPRLRENSCGGEILHATYNRSALSQGQLQKEKSLVIEIDFVVSLSSTRFISALQLPSAARAKSTLPVWLQSRWHCTNKNDSNSATVRDVFSRLCVHECRVPLEISSATVIVDDCRHTQLCPIQHLGFDTTTSWTDLRGFLAARMNLIHTAMDLSLQRARLGPRARHT